MTETKSNHYQNISRLIAKATSYGIEEAGIVEDCVNAYVEEQIRMVKEETLERAAEVADKEDITRALLGVGAKMSSVIRSLKK